MAKYLNPEQFRALPLSEAIPYVIDDMKRFVKMGIKIDMDEWYENEESTTGATKICSVCAGGAACLGFYSDEEIKRFDGALLKSGGLSSEKIWQQYLYNIKITFNYIRELHPLFAFGTWYPNETPIKSLIYDLKHCRQGVRSFNGVLKPKRLSELYAYMKRVAKVLKKHGY